MPVPVAASQLVHLGAFVAPLVLGVLVTLAGQLWRSRWLVLTGLLVLAVVFVFFGFVLRPGS